MNKKNNKILIIFDMDGLMFDTETIAIKMWKKVGESFGYDIRPSHIIETLGIDAVGTKKILEKHFGKEFPFQKMRTLREEYALNHIEENGIPVKDGLYELLDFLEDNRIKKAIATSSERKKVEKFLSFANIKNRFDCIVCGDEITNGKPEPEIFLKVAQKTGFNSDGCFVLEDSESGIIAASRAGMKPVFIKDIKGLSKSTEKLIFKEFDSLLKTKDYFESVWSENI